MLPRSNRLSTNPGDASAPLWLRTGFWICIVIALAVVIRRVLAFASPAQSGPPQMVDLDRAFSSHAALTLAHILPAAAFVILLPFVFFRRFANLEWPEQWLFPLGVIVGITAYAMSTYSVGGWVERSAVFFYNTLFLFSLGQAWRYKLRNDWLSKRRWLMRGVAVLLGIATTRPVMGVFFATSSLTHLSPQQFFGIAFWIGFSINWIIVEIWIWRSRLDEGKIDTTAELSS
jgi:hypothetical protein